MICCLKYLVCLEWRPSWQFIKLFVETWNYRKQILVCIKRKKEKNVVRIVVKFDWKSLTYVVYQNCKWEKSVKQWYWKYMDALINEIPWRESSNETIERKQHCYSIKEAWSCWESQFLEIVGFSLIFKSWAQKLRKRRKSESLLFYQDWFFSYIYSS